MRRTIALTIAGVAAAAAFVPLPSASAVCWPDLSSVGVTGCFGCPHAVPALVKNVTGYDLIQCQL